MKDDLNLVLDDLPEGATPGRSGLPAQAPIAARVRLVSSKLLQSQLQHLSTDVPRQRIERAIAKYRKPPDHFYGGGATLTRLLPQRSLRHMS